jgi:hypothetical protein
MRSICDHKLEGICGVKESLILSFKTKILHRVDSETRIGIVAATILTFALLFRLAAAYSNYGFLALDDYYLLSTSVPAQVAQDAYQQVDRAQIRSPIPILFVHSVASFAYRMGLSDPVDQIRTVYILLGIFSLISIYYAYLIFQFLGFSRTALIAASLLSFHFLFPYISTRALLESMSAPFLMASLYFLIRYQSAGERLHLILSIVWLGAASLFRFQAGVVAVSIPVIVYLRHRAPGEPFRSTILRSLADQGVVVFSGIAVLILTGLPDLWLRGEFHASLLEYMKYNVAHSSSYGVRPFWSYLPTLLGVSLAPLYISRYRDFDWRSTYRPLLPALLYLMIFFMAHSAVPHKEERFLIPILPILLILLAPLTEYLLFERRASLRMSLLLCANLLLLPFVTVSLSQANTIGLVRYFNAHHEATRLIVFENSLEHLPISYAVRPGVDILIIHRDQDAGQLTAGMSCGDIMAVRKDMISMARPITRKLEETIRFDPGILEKILIAASPRSNTRRDTILAFRPAGCEEQRVGNVMR